MLLSLREQPGKHREAILDGLVRDRDSLVRAVERVAPGEGDLARRVLKARDYVYDIFEPKRTISSA